MPPSSSLSMFLCIESKVRSMRVLVVVSSILLFGFSLQIYSKMLKIIADDEYYFTENARYLSSAPNASAIAISS
jgi:hypothetical protein